MYIVYFLYFFPAVSTANPNTAIIKKRGRTTNKTPNKTLEKHSDQEDVIMDDSEIGQGTVLYFM